MKSNRPNIQFHPGSFYIFIFSLLLIFGILSCDPNRIFEKNVRIPDGIWQHDNIVDFELMVEDTISSYNLFVNVRNTNLYPMSNLYIFITTIAPSGHSVLDTIDVIITDEKGKRLGSGLGDIWDLQQPYKANVRFAQKGKYRFRYEQAMRVERLPFILDVGLRVEKAD